jgi:16S rRNA processing protein RimM
VLVVAGTIGRPHGLDGSFYVAQPRAQLLTLGTSVVVGELTSEIVRRAGTQARPIVRLGVAGDREAIAAMRGTPLRIEVDEPPALGPDEWWADELEGAIVFDGEREIGVVVALLAFPSCECLEVRRIDGGEDLLVPLVRAALRYVDVQRRRIDVDLAFLGEGGAS